MSIQDKRKIPFMVHSELDDLQLPLAEFRVYCHVVRRAGSLEGGSFWASIPNAAKHIGVDPKTFRRALSGLIEKGLLQRTERSGKTSIITIADISEWKKRVESAPLPKSTPPKIPDVPLPKSPGVPLPKLPGVPLPKTVDKGIPIEGIPIEGKTIIDSGKPEIDARAPSLPKIPERHAAIIDAWNEHSGNLPKVRSVSEARTRALDRFLRNAKNSSSEPAALMAIAARVVAADAFWQARKYGLDNLLAGDKYMQKAEVGLQEHLNPTRSAEEELLAYIEGEGRSD